jgi:hypothetical protein
MSVVALGTTVEVTTCTVRKWLARFGSEGVAGLQDRSSAPHLVVNQLAAPRLAMHTLRPRLPDDRGGDR